MKIFMKAAGATIFLVLGLALFFCLMFGYPLFTMTLVFILIVLWIFMCFYVEFAGWHDK